MASFNKVLLMGNLTRNVELRFTPSGTAVADIGLAVNEKFKNKAGEIVESVVYVNVAVWGRQAETSAEYLHKGSPVFVEGKLQLDTWENSKGEKRYAMKVRADRVQFLSPGKKENPNAEMKRSAPEPEPDFSEDDVPF